MRYRKEVLCDVCKKTIIMPRGRIEKDSYGYMQICHHECSTGMNDPRSVISDIELDGWIYTSPEEVYERLCFWRSYYPDCAVDCTSIIDKIFIED